MAKFAVGEVCVLVNTRHPQFNGELGTVLALPQSWYWTCPHIGWESGSPMVVGPNEYVVETQFGCGRVTEDKMRKLPPDDHADDTSEDPGLTRLKKLLEQDALKSPKPVKA